MYSVALLAFRLFVIHRSRKRRREGMGAGRPAAMQNAGGGDRLAG